MANHRTSATAIISSLSLALLLAVPASTQAPGRRLLTVLADGRQAASGEALVKIRAGSQLSRVGVETQIDADESEAVGSIGIRRLHSRRFGTDELVDILRSDPRVQYAEPNYVVSAVPFLSDAQGIQAITPNDPQFPSQWGLLNTGQSILGVPGKSGADIGATLAWSRSTGSRAAVVAVVDTGVDYTHADLAANIWSAPSAFTVTIGGTTITCASGTHGFNAITRTCDPKDDNNHGTHVSGTIGAAGNNGVGVVGVNWVASIMGVKFLSATGSGLTSDAINGIEFVIQAKAAFASTGGANVRVLSNSWGGGGFSQALLDEINKANAQDMLFVAAAGNGNSSGVGVNDDVTPFYPGSYNAANVIAVAATDNNDHIATFSNYGHLSVHLGAPGVSVLSTTLNNTYSFFSGTSMATPHVSGAAALVLSQCALTTAALKSTLLGGVDPIPALSSITISGGRLNVNSALSACSAAATPTGLTAVARNSHIDLHWASSATAITYNIKRGLTSGAETLLAAGVTATSYSDTLVVSGQRYFYVVTALNAKGESPSSNEVFAPIPVAGDLDGDGKADVTVFRPLTGTWFVQYSTAATGVQPQWGAPGDVPVPRDYDGDGKIDVAVFRPSTGTWYVLYSSTGTAATIQWGNGSDDLPVPGDYDGDAKADIAVYRPSTGTWFIWYSKTQTAAILRWGGPGDVPVPGDYDSDDKTDIAVYRPSTGTWYVNYSSTGAAATFRWGFGDDVPVVGDFDGDGRADIAVFRPSTGTWYLLSVGTGSVQVIQWGGVGDVPIPGDFDGDGRTDVAVFRPSTGTWYILYSSTGAGTSIQWGSGADIPILKQ